MKPPIHRLKKSEIQWLASHTCSAHHHDFLTHYNCYLKEHPNTDRVGFFDIETYGLDADFGILLSYCIKLAGKDDILYNVITHKDISTAKAGDEDRRVVTACVNDLAKFDTIITHYGNAFRFDIPFVRTRAVAMGIPFPYYGTIKQYDTYPILKSRFKLSRNRQENAVRTLVGTTEKNHISGRYWRAAARGDTKALGYVLDHNKRDVRDLERLWNKIKDFARRADTSI